MSKVIVRCITNGHEFVYTSNDTPNNINMQISKCSNCGHIGTVFVISRIDIPNSDNTKHFIVCIIT